MKLDTYPPCHFVKILSINSTRRYFFFISNVYYVPTERRLIEINKTIS